MANKKHITHFLEPPILTASPFVVGDNQLIVCNGVNPSHELGVLKKDLGYAQVGSTVLAAGQPIRSLYHFKQEPGTDKLLATCNDAAGDDDTMLYYSIGGNWTPIGAAETAWNGEENMDIEMESFIKHCFFVGYASTDGFLPVGSLTGTTFSTSENVTNMPQAKYIKRYRDRLYVANCNITATTYPYRVYFSSVPSAGAITWTVASDFIDVDYSDEITGIEQNWDRLVIFTEFSAYMYDQASKKKVWDIGCAGQRTIQNLGATMIFANKDNVYASTGGRPVPIGNNILELLRNSTPSAWRSAVIDEEYNLYLGGTAAVPVTAGGISYVNLMATLNMNTGMWRWREFSDDIYSMAKYTTGGDDFLVLGAADSEIHKKSKYSDTTPISADDGKPINAHWRTKPYDLGDPSVIKKIKKITTYTEFGNNMMIRFRVFNKNREILMPFNDIGVLNKVVNTFEDLKKLEGYFIQIEGRERSDQKAFRFFGFSLEFDLASNK